MENLLRNTRSKILYMMLASGLWACAKPVTHTVNPETVSLEKKWETEGNLLTPESVLYDRANKIIYVSNINGQAGEKDGNGSIGRITLDGKIDQAEWVKGLDAPKGMGLHQGKLYVADLTQVIIIDTKTGQKIANISLPGAQFLNDITVDNKGNIYVSDSSGKKVYRIINNQAEVYMESNQLVRPNGLLAYQNNLYIVDMQPGIFYTIDNNTKALNKVAEGLTSGDGIVALGQGDFMVSNWNGEINYLFADGTVKKLLDTKEGKINAADIDYIPERNLLLVPTFFNNKVMAYQLKR